jgi:hypothetical protein
MRHAVETMEGMVESIVPPRVVSELMGVDKPPRTMMRARRSRRD